MYGMHDDVERILKKAAERGGQVLEKPAAPVSITEINVDDLVDYLVCPARYFMSTGTEIKSNRRIIRERTRKAFNTLVFENVGRSKIEQSHIKRMMNEVFSSISYTGIENDMKDFVASAVRFSNILTDNEYVIHGPMKPITFVHNNTLINSDMSLSIKELRNGYIYPVVIDFSKTKYDPSYNPIIYRAHIVAEHFDVKGTTTNIQVFSVGSDRRWVYDHRKYFTALRASLRETIEMLRADLYPLRFGWWCSSCDYRGLCHKKSKRP